VQLRVRGRPDHKSLFSRFVGSYPAGCGCSQSRTQRITWSRHADLQSRHDGQRPLHEKAPHSPFVAPPARRPAPTAPDRAAVCHARSGLVAQRDADHPLHHQGRHRVRHKLGRTNVAMPVGQRLRGMCTPYSGTEGAGEMTHSAPHKLPKQRLTCWNNGVNHSTHPRPRDWGSWVQIPPLRPAITLTRHSTQAIGCSKLWARSVTGRCRAGWTLRTCCAWRVDGKASPSMQR